MASALEREKEREISDEEKIAENGVEREHLQTLDDIPDPDAGLSAEERAAHVFFPFSVFLIQH